MAGEKYQLFSWAYQWRENIVSKKKKEEESNERGGEMKKKK